MFPPPHRSKKTICKGKVTPVKRLKKCCDEDSEAAAPRGFIHLPVELKMRIVELACRPRASQAPEVSEASSSESSDDSIAPFSPSFIDVKTALSLALVNREIGREITCILYTNIQITRPSSLLRLQQTLAARPALGRIVRSLHIGPLDGTPGAWDPMASKNLHTQRGVVNEIMCGLQGIEEEALLPVWYEPTRLWTIEDGSYPRGCQEAAVFAAIRVAGYALKVNPRDQMHDNDGVNIGMDAWTVKIFELQAALDLYLMEMRRVEERNGYDVKSWRSPEAEDQAAKYIHKGRCKSYPPLSLIMPAKGAPVVNVPGVFTITLAQIHQHLARPGSIGDRFDHPLLFSRSGVKGFVRYGPGRGGDDGGEGDYHQLVRERDGSPTYVEATNGEDFADLWSVVGLGRNRDDDIKLPRELCDELDAAFPTAATLGSLLATARMVLSATPSLDNLSLTGFLERAICGSRSPPALKALKSLSLGPPPPFWYAPMRLDHSAIASVERLRIAGVMLFKSEIASIAGHAGALPKLKKLEWMLAAKYDGAWNHISLLRTIQHLLRRPLTSPTPAEPVWSDEEDNEDEVEEGTDDDEGQDSQESPSAARSTRTLPGSVSFEVHLDPADIESLLKAAPSEEVRKAWSKGRPDPHRLILVESRAAKAPEGDEHFWGGTPKRTQVLYEEGWEWWDARSTDLWAWS